MAAALAVLWLALAPAARADDVFAHPATAQELKETILAVPAAELAVTRVLSGRFEQRRFLGGIPRPLVSRGDFLVAREAGVRWYTREPFATEFILTPAGMTLRDPGSTGTHIPTAEQPALRAVLEILSAMFALDVVRLGESFELFGITDGQHWEVGLRPRSSALAATFREARLRGAHDVETIELAESHDDRIEIALSNLTTRSTPLTAEEAALFR